MRGPIKREDTKRYQFVLTDENMRILRYLAQVQQSSMSGVLRRLLDRYAKGKLRVV